MEPFAKLREWESKSDLLEHLNASPRHSILLGHDTEAPKKYFSFTVSSKDVSLAIGVLSSGLGTKPSIAVLSQGSIAFVGHDSCLSAIDVHDGKLIFDRRLNGVFFEFIPIDSDTEIVIVHELGALRLDTKGQEKWTIDTEIIADFTIDARGILSLTIMDSGHTLKVELNTGAITKIM